MVVYAADLADIAKEHCITIQSFADDTQLYLHCSRDDAPSTIIKLEHCIKDIITMEWMSANQPKLNTDKTELLWADTIRSLQNFSFQSLQLFAAPQ